MALIAFGADSVIETLCGVVVFGQLLAPSQSRTPRQFSEHRFLFTLFHALALDVIEGETWALVAHH